MYLLDCVFWVIWKNQYDFPIPELCHNPFFLPTLPQRGGEKKTSQWFSKRGSDSVKTLADVAVIWTTSAFRNKVKSHSSNWWTQLLALHATYTLTSHLADKTACSCLNLIPGWYVLLPLYSEGSEARAQQPKELWVPHLWRCTRPWVGPGLVGGNQGLELNDL